MLQIGTRVHVHDRGCGVLEMDNEDGTWSIGFDDNTEADVPEAEVRMAEDQSLDYLRKSSSSSVAPPKLQDLLSGIRLIIYAVQVV